VEIAGQRPRKIAPNGPPLGHIHTTVTPPLSARRISDIAIGHHDRCSQSGDHAFARISSPPRSAFAGLGVRHPLPAGCDVGGTDRPAGCRGFGWALVVLAAISSVVFGCCGDGDYFAYRLS
jgi:hypothetical protein